MITTVTKQSNAACADMRARIQGAPSRLHDASVVIMAIGSVPFRGAAVGDDSNGGQGSRAWSPPV